MNFPGTVPVVICLETAKFILIKLLVWIIINHSLNPSKKTDLGSQWFFNAFPSPFVFRSK